MPKGRVCGRVLCVMAAILSRRMFTSHKGDSMNYEELKAATAQCEGMTDREARNIAIMVGRGNMLLPQFGPALEAATTTAEFFENIYADETLRGEYAWALIAKACHEDWLSCFTPLAVYADIPTSGGKVEFKGIDDSPDFSVSVGGSDNACIYVFDDGSVNVLGLEALGECFGCFEVAGHTIDGEFGVFRRGNEIVITMFDPETVAERRPKVNCCR